MKWFYRRFGKRLLDLSVAVPAAILLLPVATVTGLLVLAFLGRPVFFCQPRAGRRGRVFRLWKFRTMRDRCDARGRLLPDAERLTRIGNWLRRFSLDELPQLWNVLRGEMSLIGPRPLLVRYLDRYTPTQARRHEVLPGITGWAQVNGRNAVDWERRFELDVWYADHLGFWLDLKIFARTFHAALGPTGVNHPDHVTMPEFMGSAACPPRPENARRAA